MFIRTGTKLKAKETSNVFGDQLVKFMQRGCSCE